MHVLLRAICLASSLTPAYALAQSRDAGQDAELKQLRETVEVLTARIQALEASQAATPPGAATPALAGTTAQAAGTSAGPALTMPTALKLIISPLPARESFDEDDQASARADNEVPAGSDLAGLFQVPGSSTWMHPGRYGKLDA